MTKKIKVYHTRYQSTRDNAQCFAVKNEDVDRVAALVGAHMGPPDDDRNYRVVDIENPSPAWEATYK